MKKLIFLYGALIFFSTQLFGSHGESGYTYSSDGSCSDDESSPLRELLKAVKCGGVDKIRHLLEVGNNSNYEERDSEGRTALYCAAAYGHLGVVKLLAGRGADINAEDEKGCTPLGIAVRNGRCEVIQWLAGQGADLNAGDTLSGYHLYPVALAGRLDILRWLVGEGADINATKENGWRVPFLGAVENGNLDVMRWLADRGADINASDWGGWTALHKAAYAGWVEVALFLAELGAAIDVKDEEGRTPLYIAVLADKLGVVQLLAGLGADINAEDEEGCTPLFEAAQRGHLDVVRWLVENGADVNASSKGGRTPLYMAAMCAYPDSDVVQFFIENGADLNVVYHASQMTLLELALKDGNTSDSGSCSDSGSDEYEIDSDFADEMVCLLCSHGVELGMLNDEQRNKLLQKLLKCRCMRPACQVYECIATEERERNAKDALAQALRELSNDECRLLLFHCAEKGLKHAAQIIINEGTDVNSADDEGKTPLHYAARAGHDRFIRKLINKHEANPLVRDVDGKLPEWYARERNNSEALEELVEVYPYTFIQDPEVFEDLVGLEEATANLCSVLESFLKPRRRRRRNYDKSSSSSDSSDSEDNMRASAYKGFLIAGPHGTGKKSLVTCLEKKYEDECKFVESSGIAVASNLVNGEVVKIREAFQEARKETLNSPTRKTILVFNMFEAMGSRTQGTTGNSAQAIRQAARAVCSEMTSQCNNCVFVICTTARPEQIDDSLLSHLRLLKLNRPSEGERLSFMLQHLYVYPSLDCSQEFLGYLARNTKEFSYRDIHQLLENAGDEDRLESINQERLIDAHKGVKERMLQKIQADSDGLFNLKKTCYLRPPGEDSVNASELFTRIDLPFEIRGQVAEFIDFINRFDEYRQAGHAPQGHHLIFAGPPGTGKSYLAELIAEYSEVTFVHVTKTLTSTRDVATLFESVQHLAPCIIFIDEIDSIGAINRDDDITGLASPVINECLQHIEGIGTDKDSLIMLIGATNRDDKLDGAFRQRFKVVNFTLPDAQQRLEIMRLCMNAHSNIDVQVCNDDSFCEEFIHRTQGCSGRDIRKIVATASCKAIYEGDDLAAEDHLLRAMDEVLH